MQVGSDFYVWDGYALDESEVKSIRDGADPMNIGPPGICRRISARLGVLTISAACVVASQAYDKGDPQDIVPIETDQKTGHGWRQWGLFHVRLKDGRVRWVYGWINWDGYIGVDRIVPDPRLSP